MIASRLARIEDVAIGVVLVLLAPGVAPVVEDLAAEKMPADAPGMPVAPCHHDLLTHLDRVQVDHFKRNVIDLGFEPERDEQRVMVGRLVAAIEAHERADRRSVGQAHDVGGDEAERVHVPAGACVEVRGFEHEVTELCDLRRLENGTLCVVNPNRLARRVMGNWRTDRLTLELGEAVMDRDRDAFRIAEPHNGSAAGSA